MSDRILGIGCFTNGPPHPHASVVASSQECFHICVECPAPFLLQLRHFSCAGASRSNIHDIQTTLRQRAITGAHSQQVVQWSIRTLTLVEDDIWQATLNGRFTFLHAVIQQQRVSVNRVHQQLRQTRVQVHADTHDESRTAALADAWNVRQQSICGRRVHVKLRGPNQLQCEYATAAATRV